MRLRSVLAAAIAAAASTTTLLAIPAHAASAQHRAAGEAVATTLYDAIDHLAVADEDRTGYERTKFRHWIDADKNGCNTRKEVILAEAVEAPEVGPGCSLTGGSWYSPYDGVTVTDAAGLDVDHVVPLAEAWDSGASTWTPKERERYANDLHEPRALIAVTAKSNRSKADKDVSDWLPVQNDQCEYVTDWTVVKTRWGLTIDQREQDTLRQLAAGCPNEPITVELAR
ncbi:HNH endonuclease family protein [Kitasatospora sp. NPDC048540]|uniref:HNH endonuclease family protein n=1 Tax=Kitasatospora sp. NPDC048540 TaxID=3155634 RepID=UPI0033F4DC2A